MPQIDNYQKPTTVTQPSISSTRYKVLLFLAASMIFPWGANAQTIINASGTDASAIQNSVDNFRNLLGNLNTNTPENFDGGRRQINWDAAPDAVSDPNAFPGDFFNFNASPRARGIEFKETGDTTGFLLSSTQASGQPTNFGFSSFDTFSPERLFTPVGGTSFDVVFYNPANPDQLATSTGLGVVFSDVDVPELTSMSFYDIEGNLLAQESPEAFNDGLSFLGVVFDEAIVAKVSIVAGDFPILSNGVLTDTSALGLDVVVMDDFIFGEPTPIPEPGSMLLVLTTLATVGLANRHGRMNR